jgi:hypothetical protein
VRWVGLGTLALLGMATSAVGAGLDEASPVATALAFCRDADFLPAHDKDAQRVFLESGLAVAEEAVAAHPDDPRAHVALSCILGKQLEVSGVSWRSLQRLNRLKGAIDTALRLAPGDPDALVAKGEMLRQLPGVLGGDPYQAEQLLRFVVAKNPDHLQARLCLARLLAERHDSEARRAASVALSLAQGCGTPRERADARALYGQVSP